MLDPGDEEAHRSDRETTGHRHTGALHQPYYDRLDAVFAGCSADEIAVLHDWFSRSTNLALAHIEELRATDADGEQQGRPTPGVELAPPPIREGTPSFRRARDGIVDLSRSTPDQADREARA
ncbi:hypothetical protein [Streptomyces sp. LUP47B]|uniref:hypothetical protein n=1 Tax=Streptomyces sp. LUP47B TaxID=1890286 RepID=UPI003520CF18